MDLYRFIVPLGIAGYTALAVAFLTGFLKFKFHARWIKVQWHIWAGITAMILATAHAVIVILANS